VTDEPLWTLDDLAKRWHRTREFVMAKVRAEAVPWLNLTDDPAKPLKPTPKTILFRPEDIRAWEAKRAAASVGATAAAPPGPKPVTAIPAGGVAGWGVAGWDGKVRGGSKKR